MEPNISSPAPTTTSKIIFIGVCVFALLVVANLLYLDLKVTSQTSQPSPSFAPEASSSPNSTSLAQPLATTTPGCDVNCQAYVSQQIAAAKTAIIQNISATTPQASPNSSPVSTPASITPHPLDYYLSFGSDGASQSTTYVSLNGTQISFNTANYPGAKAFYFQANLRSDAPDKGAWARVVNTSTGGGIPGSDISMNGSLTSVFEESEPLSMPSGNVTLQVQVHSLDGNFAYVEGAKLRIAY